MELLIHWVMAAFVYVFAPPALLRLASGLDFPFLVGWWLKASLVLIPFMAFIYLLRHPAA